MQINVKLKGPHMITQTKPNSPSIRSSIKPMFSIGNLVATCSVTDRMEKDPAFREFVSYSYRRYISCDWGDTCKADQRQNDIAVRDGERILAEYRFDKDTKLWIITEWDRSVTTLLFPDDY